MIRKLFLLSIAWLCAGYIFADEPDNKTKDDGKSFAFAAPVQLKADGEFIKVESPGYASPCWADIDGDGQKDLLVGQFNSGKIKVFRNLKDDEFAEGEWLKTGDNVAEIPGVW